MGKNRLTFALRVIIIFVVVGAGSSIVFGRFVGFSDISSVVAAAEKTDVAAQTGMATSPAGCAIAFNPPAIQDAPANIKDAVMLGHNILTDTGKYAGQYVGNKLDCSNCHFKGGMTQGGKNGGLSLVGVAASYPQYKKRQNYSVDLVIRTNDCFERSLNGKPLPADSKEMTAIITYYQWIAKGLPIYAEIPWLGVKHLKSAHKPDVAKGKQVFAQKCTLCHGDNGQGTPAAPPIWGNDSFNDGAGMRKQENLAAFAKGNMPKGNPDLTAEQALDVAAFVAAQPRPHFAAKLGSGAPPTTAPLSPSQLAPGAAEPQTPQLKTTPPQVPAFADRSKIPASGKQGPPAEAARLIGSWKQGKALFDRDCQSCHGPQGTDKVPNPGSDDGTVPPLNPIDPSLANKKPSIFAANIDRIIQHGSIPDGPHPVLFMPNWGDSRSLSQQEIAAIEAYVIHLNGVQRTKKE